MDAVGVKDFTVKDIVTPDPKRTRRICSALINFVRFREGRMQYYTKLQCKLVSDCFLPNHCRMNLVHKRKNWR